MAPSTASATAAEADAAFASTSDPTTNNLVTFNASTTDAAAYDNYLMMEEYLVVPTNTVAPAKATKLAQLIRFVLGPTGQKVIESFGAAPATTAMATAGLKVAAQLSTLGLERGRSDHHHDDHSRQVLLHHNSVGHIDRERCGDPGW